MTWYYDWPFGPVPVLTTLQHAITVVLPSIVVPIYGRDTVPLRSATVLPQQYHRWRFHGSV